MRLKVLFSNFEADFTRVDYKKLIQTLRFSPKENAADIFTKKYADGYVIEVDFAKETINYGNKIQAESKITQNFLQLHVHVYKETIEKNKFLYGRY
jgi:type I restriction enzyme M protein